MEPDDGLMRRETYRLIGAALEVLNAIGHGLHEKPYENALVVELTATNIPCEQQKRFPVLYKSVQVTEYVPDLIAFGSVIIVPRSLIALPIMSVGRCLTISESPAARLD
jgi:GxxExxY protein